MSDDWRIRIELPEEHHAGTLLGRFGLELTSDEGRRLAEELEGRRLAVSQDENDRLLDQIGALAGPDHRLAITSSRPDRPLKSASAAGGSAPGRPRPSAMGCRRRPACRWPPPTSTATAISTW